MSSHLVYFIKEVPHPKDQKALSIYKIGRTKNLTSRIATLQTGNYHVLHCYRTIECADEKIASEIETQLHRLFEADCLGGEWFHIEQARLDGVIEQISELLKNNLPINVISHLDSYPRKTISNKFNKEELFEAMLSSFVSDCNV